MKRLVLVAVIASASGIEPCLAQATVNSPPAMGRTSPLGLMGANAQGPSSSGIPLGATELNPAGLSPLLGGTTLCLATGGLAPGSTGGATSSFDGGGTSGGPGLSLSNTCTSAASSGSPSATSSASGSSAAGGVVPLGATEIGNTGVSPLITVAPPAINPTAPAAATVSPPAPSSSPCNAASPTLPNGSNTLLGSAAAVASLSGVPGATAPNFASTSNSC